MRVIYRHEARIIIDKHLSKISDQELMSVYDLNQEELDSIFDRYAEGGIDTFTVKRENRRIHDEFTESNHFLRMQL